MSVHVVVSRDNDIQAFMDAADADDPVTLVTFQKEKLQNKAEHGLDPAVHDTIIVVGRRDAAFRVMEDGELAGTGAEENASKLLPI